MAVDTVKPRAHDDHPRAPRGRLETALSRPLAFALTAAVLLAIFGWTFFANPDRVAPTKDPAYYTWRTEMLLSEDPVTLLEVEGPEEIFSAGYRVTAPVIGGFLRRIADIGSLKVTVFLMVGLPVLTALLLAAFAYRELRDPLIFHSVALASAGLLLTDPFVGYLDNMLCLFFLAAALPFLRGTRDSWPARIGFGMFLFLAGMTHPTTLVIFCVVLGAMAVWRLVFRRFDLRSVIRDDGPMLVTAFLAAVLVAAVWTIGIWGKSAPLGEAALPPPYDKDFFVDRLVDWVKSMRPAINFPLLLVGAGGLVAASVVSPRRKTERGELARVSIVWLAPLAGLFGFLAGLTYPYYRFFNTTLAWVLLVGVGIFFAARFFIATAARGGAARWAALGVLALGVILVTNVTAGYESTGWNNAAGGWLSAQERADLDALRGELAAEVDEDRPVVFVIDTDDHSPRVYGYNKLAGNTSRYGLPPGQIDRGYVYLGSLDSFLAGEPTEVGAETYDEWSQHSLDHIQEEGADQDALIVVAQIFNETGSNAALAAGEGPVVTNPGDAWIVREGLVFVDGDSSGTPSTDPDEPGPLHAVWVALAVLMLMVPGFLALKWFLPDATFPDVIPMAAALSIALLSIVGLVVLAVARAPFSEGIAWLGLGLCLATGVALRLLARSQEAPAVPA